MVLFQADLDWARAEAEFQQAIALNPSNSSAHRSYGFLLWTLQRFAEAKKQALAAIELDPLLDGPRLCLADALWYAGDLDSAVETLEKAREVLGDSHILREFLSLAHSQAGRAAAALEMVATFEESPDLGARFHRAYVLAYLGRLEELRTIMTDAEEGRITEPFGVMARATG
jgi:tetratricopeptide (TPR) repeat protein